MNAEVSIGLPVELGEIPKALKRLWLEGEGTLTRASLVNFVVRCEGSEAMLENTRLIARFMQAHACRAILVSEEPSTKPSVEAWISAHCHVTRAGAKQVCCEQITFRLAGVDRRNVANMVLAHLDSDLPLWVWWQGDLPEPRTGETLLPWVDRLVFDSAAWPEFSAGRRTLRAILEHYPGIVPCDLNWARILPWRQAVAQVFDHPAILAMVPSIARVRVVHAPAHRSTAALLAGWIMAQIGWSEPDQPTFARLRVELTENPGDAIQKCAIGTDAGEISVVPGPCGEFLHASLPAPGSFLHAAVPCGRGDTLSLLDRELTRGGRHPVYLRALDRA